MPTYSGLYNSQYTDGQTAIGVGLPTAVINDSAERNGVVRTELGKWARTRAGRIMAQLIIQLTGSAAGNTATVTHRRAASDPNATPLQLGGRRTIETQTLINRATTASDITQIDADLAMAFGPTTYPADRSGNGGGSKIGGF